MEQINLDGLFREQIESLEGDSGFLFYMIDHGLDAFSILRFKYEKGSTIPSSLFSSLAFSRLSASARIPVFVEVKHD